MKMEKLVDFENHSNAQYTLVDIENDWGKPVAWLNGVNEGRTSIVQDGSRVLECRYLAEKFGPSDGGAQFKVPIRGNDEYYMEYRLKFDEDFEWVRGGKLPGLAGGSTPTGGHGRTDGFSSRYMWRPEGEVELYLYWAEQTGVYGDMIRPGKYFKRGVWHTMKQFIKMNTPGECNGTAIVWMDGEKIYERNDFKFRLEGAEWTIDYFLFSTFYGGNDPSWAPIKDNFVHYDDFKIWTDSVD